MGSLVVTGKIATLATGVAADREAKRGRVWIQDGRITNITPATTELEGFTGVTRVDVGDNIVLPGFIDMHNHTGYNSIGLWAQSDRAEPWLHNTHWTGAKTYQSHVVWPAACFATATPEALLAYIQTRALVGGTTTQQGWPQASRQDLRALRSVDADGGVPGRTNPIESSVGELSGDALARRGQKVAQGIGFIYHCSEGVHSSVGDQFDAARQAGVLGKTFIGVHCCGVTPQQWSTWTKSEAGAVAWSPFSNLWLYGKTTEIPAARKQSVSVCLGSDWGPSGTKNLLGELKVARLVSAQMTLTKPEWGLTDDDLLNMVTVNPGRILERCWNVPVGRLVPGALGDLTVIRATGTTRLASQVVNATEDTIALVIVDGEPRYGDRNLMTAAKATNPFALTVANRKRLVSLPPRPPIGTTPAQNWSWESITGELNAVIADPAKTVKLAKQRRNAWAGPHSATNAPLILTLDMPGGGPSVTAGLPRDFTKVVFGELPSLVHDADFINAIHNRGFHGGILDGLKTWFT
jgi:5-methylthioadenosine/S-adenosylhomocysteine deaminase